MTPYRRRIKTVRGGANKTTITQVEVECFDNGLWSINGKTVGDDIDAVKEICEILNVLVDKRETIKELAEKRRARKAK